MKKFLVLVFLLITVPVFGAPPSRVSTYTSGTTIRSADVTSNEDAIFNYLRTGVDTFLDSSIVSADIFDGTIVNSDISTSAAIANSKLNLTTITQDITHSGTLTHSGSASFTTITSLGTVTTGAVTGIDINGGSWDGGIIGASSAPRVDNINIDGGTMDGVNIGTTTATGELIVNDSNDDADGLGSQGTSGQFLKSAGTGANPTWANQPMELISTTTWGTGGGTGVTSVDITKGYRYILILYSSTSTADEDLEITFDTDTGASDYAWASTTLTFAGSPTETNAGDDADNSIVLGPYGGAHDFSGYFLVDATGTNNNATLTGQFYAVNKSDVRYMGQVSGVYLDAGTLTTIDLNLTGGNAASGKIQLYRLNES